ncbi:TetR/AcrR family transcriptional regulator [Amphritea sp. 2_MG-2023]|uniref:TetR/AcrR family transcriptional regulator n=1 Tax=Amphritea TaxID=515417 RepID=UPI002090F7C5|nr:MULTISPECIES: TetR/AcrR family transcriptional regulator [Amphritea]MDO6420652.1 TetR/AcrR family transcriptional regulator [Amphritea sp. 2_MG-2023]MDX2423701.1 TetR/AcrR family transcriptional regulator [Amphritea sp.]
MTDKRRIKTAQDLAPRNAPVQGRSKMRSKQIIDVTGELLERVGLDDLNTILIAKEVGISVGSLYHYFPNKHAILYAMGSRWLETVEAALDEIDRWPVETLPMATLVERMLALKLKTYKQQKAILTLVQAMFSVPELRELDEQHDELEITRMAAVFKRMGINRHLKERQRLGRLYLEVTHSVMLVVVNQKGERAKRTLADLNMIICNLLRQYSEADG